MENEYYKVIGVMSGTSLDGLDIACCSFNYAENNWKFEIEKATTIEYDDSLRKKLSDIYSADAEEISLFNVEYGKWIGLQINEFIKNNSLKNVDLISSHGHTIFHQPQKRFTLQIGDGNAIAAQTNLNVVYDFRSLDLALGGQGAPLVPVGDNLLFSEYEFCLNLGGFANISFLKNEKRIAFDICPVNILLNYLANKEGKNYDNNGEIASSGKINHMLLEKLNSLEYYKQSPPKSLGREWLEKEIFSFPEFRNNSVADLLYTCCEHISQQISIVINTYNSRNNSSVLITGGGTFNGYLIKKLKENTKAEIVIPSAEIINYKEALIFAFLGLLRLKKKINVYSVVTGASRDSCSGAVVLGGDF